MFVVNHVLDNFTTRIAWIDHSSQRQTLIRTIAIDVRSLQLIAQGILPLDRENSTREKMQEAIGDLEYLHNHMYQNDDMSFDPIVQIYTRPVVSIYDPNIR